MSTEVAKTATFEERIYAKIRADIGSLMTDEDLKKLVDTTMQRVFFTKRERARHGGWGEQYFDPPLIEEMVKELLEPTLQKAMVEWLEAHQADTLKICREALAGGFTQAVARALDFRMGQVFANLSVSLAEQLKVELGGR